MAEARLLLRFGSVGAWLKPVALCLGAARCALVECIATGKYSCVTIP